MFLLASVRSTLLSVPPLSFTPSSNVQARPHHCQNSATVAQECDFIAPPAEVRAWIAGVFIVLVVVAQISVTCWSVGVGIFSISQVVGLKMSIMF